MLIFALLPKNKKMEHLTQIQRYEISWKLKEGFSKTRIANDLGVDRSTIHREIKRNRNQKTNVYEPELAHKKYKKRMNEKPKHVTFTEEIRDKATEMLLQDLSPEQIKGRCDLLGIPMVSPERLYQFVWDDKRKGGELYKYLRRNGRKYRKRGAAKDSRGIIKDRVSPQHGRLCGSMLRTCSAWRHRAAQSLLRQFRPVQEHGRPWRTIQDTR